MQPTHFSVEWQVVSFVGRSIAVALYTLVRILQQLVSAPSPISTLSLLGPLCCSLPLRSFDHLDKTLVPIRALPLANNNFQYLYLQSPILCKQITSI